MKRPGPLPPQPAPRAKADPDPDLPVDEEPVSGEPGRVREAVLAAFRRRRDGRRGAAKGEPEEAPEEFFDESEWSPDDTETDPVRSGASFEGTSFIGSSLASLSISERRAKRRQKRAERAEVRRFTERARRRRAVWWGSVGAVVLLAVGTLVASYSPLFAVQEIDVQGTSRLDPAEIQEALRDQTGRALPQVDRDEIHAKLTSFPDIESYTVQSRPPHTLEVRIVERTPVAVVQTDAGYTTVDAAGVALATSEEKPKDLPLATVEAGLSSDAFAAVGQVLRALPEDLASRVTEIHATSREDVTFTLPDGDGVTIVWGSPGDTTEKVQVLRAAFTATPPENVTSYDVSSAGVLVVTE